MLTHNLAPQPSLWFSPEGPDNGVVVVSEIQLARNLASLPFCHRMDETQETELRKRTESAFQGLDETYSLIDAERLTPTLRDFYQYRGYLTPRWPRSLSVAHEESRSFVRLGGTDHVVIAARTGGFDLTGPRTRCEHIDQVLEHELDYAVSLRLGYLGPDVRRVGTGLTAAVTLHLSALEQGEALDVLNGAEDGAFGISSAQGLYRVEYRAQAGETEEETLSKLAGYASRLVHYETEARNELVARHGDAVSEAAHRALGTLLHARRLALAEAAELLNLLRFAVAVGLVQEISLPTVTTMMMLSHDSQVAVLTEEGDSSLDGRRTQLIRALQHG